MKVKWWYFPAGLGGAVVVACILFILAFYLYAYANIAAMGFVLKGHKHYDNGEYEEAVKWYDRALKLRPFAAKVHFHHDKAKALAKLGRFEEALEAYDDALAVEHPHALMKKVYVGKARAFAGLGRWGEAVEAYGEAIKPELAGSCEDLCVKANHRFESEWYEVTVGRPHNLHETVWYEGKYVEVMAYLKAAHELEPRHGYPYYIGGRAWLALGQYEKAVSYFDVVVKQTPNFAPAWERKAWALALMGRYEAALACADRALALDADDPDAWNTRGKILLFAGEAAAARECFDRAWAQAPSSPEALLAKGMTYFAEAKYDEARPYFEELAGAGGSAHYLLYLYLVDRAEGRPGTDRLQPLLETTADPWLKKIRLFLVGRISADDLIVGAEGDRILLCGAHFFIAYKNKLDGDAAAARRHFREAVAAGRHEQAEYSLARYELARSGDTRE